MEDQVRGNRQKKAGKADTDIRCSEDEERMEEASQDDRPLPKYQCMMTEKNHCKSAMPFPQ